MNKILDYYVCYSESLDLYLCQYDVDTKTFETNPWHYGQIDFKKIDATRRLVEAICFQTHDQASVFLADAEEYLKKERVHVTMYKPCRIQIHRS